MIKVIFQIGMSLIKYLEALALQRAVHKRPESIFNKQKDADNGSDFDSLGGHLLVTALRAFCGHSTVADQQVLVTEVR